MKWVSHVYSATGGPRGEQVPIAEDYPVMLKDDSYFGTGRKFTSREEAQKSAETLEYESGYLKHKYKVVWREVGEWQDAE